MVVAVAARVKDRLTVEVGPTIKCGCGCDATILQFDEYGRERFYVHGHNTRSLWKKIKTLPRRYSITSQP